MLQNIILLLSITTVCLSNPLFKESGEVFAVNDVILTAKVNTRIVKILHKQGSFVKIGQPIILLDDRHIATQIQIKEQEIKVIQSRWDLAKIKTKESLRELKRYQRLFEQKSISKQTLDEHKSDYDIQLAEEAILANQINQQKTELAQLKIDHEEYTIYAPFNGTVLDDKQLSTGHMVQPGEALFRFADLTQLRIAADIPSIYWTKLKKVKEVRIKIEGLDKEFIGSIHWISQFVTKQTRNRKVEIKLNSKSNIEQIFPGAFSHLGFY